MATPGRFTALQDCNDRPVHGEREWQGEESSRQETSSEEESSPQEAGSEEEAGGEKGGKEVSAPTREDVLQKVAEAATESAAKQYDDYSKTFVALDAKAQAATTLGGVLLGAIVALANAGKLGVLIKCGGFWTMSAVMLPVLSALGAMVLGVLASRVAAVKVPFDAERQIKEFDEMRALPATEAIGQMELVGFHEQRQKQWKQSLSSMAGAVKSKGGLVRCAQWVVFAAAVLTVFVFGLAAVLSAE